MAKFILREFAYLPTVHPMSYKYMDILSSSRHMRMVSLRDTIYMAHLVTKDIPRLKALDIVRCLDGFFMFLSRVAFSLKLDKILSVMSD